MAPKVKTLCGLVPLMNVWFWLILNIVTKSRCETRLILVFLQYSLILEFLLGEFLWGNDKGDRFPLKYVKNNES